MDIVNHNTDSLDFLESEKAKTSLRINYEAQVEVIKKQIGDLEFVRAKLGLSARKMCQLLLVDPSAWTRWRKSNDAPPHIWRALQWYLTIQEKIPGLSAHYFIGKDSSILNAQSELKMNELKSQLESRIFELEKTVKTHRATSLVLGLATLLMGAAFLKILFFR